MLSANLNDVFSSLLAAEPLAPAAAEIASADAKCSPNPQDGMTVELEDYGQDFLEFDIKGGRIVATRPFQGWVWNGRCVDNESLAQGDLINFDGGSSEAMQLRYPVLEVRPLKTVR